MPKASDWSTWLAGCKGPDLASWVLYFVLGQGDHKTSASGRPLSSLTSCLAPRRLGRTGEGTPSASCPTHEWPAGMRYSSGRLQPGYTSSNFRLVVLRVPVQTCADQNTLFHHWTLSILALHCILDPLAPLVALITGGGSLSTDVSAPSYGTCSGDDLFCLLLFPDGALLAVQGGR